MKRTAFLCFTTHEEQEFRVVGVLADYLDDAVSRLMQMPELVAHHVTKVTPVPDEVLRSARHILEV